MYLSVCLFDVDVVAVANAVRCFYYVVQKTKCTSFCLSVRLSFCFSSIHHFEPQFV